MLKINSKNLINVLSNAKVTLDYSDPNYGCVATSKDGLKSINMDTSKISNPDEYTVRYLVNNEIVKPAEVSVFFERVKAVGIKSMTKEQARIAIAEDVIAALRIGHIEATNGKFIELHGVIGDERDSLKDVLQCQDACEVCALGGMFVAAVERFNKIKATGSTLYDLDEISPFLRQFFTKDQIKLIEMAFEQGNGAFRTSSLAMQELEARAIKFGNRFDCSEKRMIAIMKNTIRNNGTFVP